MEISSLGIGWANECTSILAHLLTVSRRPPSCSSCGDGEWIPLLGLPQGWNRMCPHSVHVSLNWTTYVTVHKTACRGAREEERYIIIGLYQLDLQGTRRTSIDRLSLSVPDKNIDNVTFGQELLHPPGLPFGIGNSQSIRMNVPINSCCKDVTVLNGVLAQAKESSFNWPGTCTARRISSSQCQCVESIRDQQWPSWLVVVDVIKHINLCNKSVQTTNSHIVSRPRTASYKSDSPSSKALCNYLGHARSQ